MSADLETTVVLRVMRARGGLVGEFSLAIACVYACPMIGRSCGSICANDSQLSGEKRPSLRCGTLSDNRGKVAASRPPSPQARVRPGQCSTAFILQIFFFLLGDNATWHPRQSLVSSQQ